ncbi:MAG: DNA-3-methyladenine glycosylase 2 family protein [Oscillospiraceae bacterium]|nr:DNA-3-methyladenine glycosylase 2 family protein [Oscillospiraceae bacterium]
MILRTEDDFSLERIAESGQCFRWERTGEGGYRIPVGEHCLYIAPLGAGEFALDCSETLFGEFWRSYFDLDADYRSIRERIGVEDPFLAGAARAEKGIRILRQDPWEVTVSFIISQNRNIPAIRRSVELLCRAAGERRTDGRGREFWIFPSPEAILALSEEALDGCRLGYRAKYVRAAAEAAASGALRLDELPDAGEEDSMAALTALYGVGPKVASCIALYGLHHLNAFPVDTWVRRILENEYPAGYPSERYSPYNGVYQQYMFACYRHRAGAATDRETPPALP